MTKFGRREANYDALRQQTAAQSGNDQSDLNNSTYLRLDATNDPVTGDVDIVVDDAHALRVLAATQVGAPFPTTLILDNFNRANEGPPPSASWTSDNFRVESNRLYPEVDEDGNITGEAQWAALPSSADHEARLTVYFDQAAAESLSVPYQAALVYLSVRRNESPAITTYDLLANIYPPIGEDPGLCQFYLRESGVAIAGPYETTFATGDSFGIKVTGNLIEGWHRPVGGAWAMVLSVTDTTLPGNGHIFISFVGNNGTGDDTSTSVWSFDDFGGGGSGTGLASDVTVFDVDSIDFVTEVIQLRSTVATGSPPLLVTSETLNVHFNADLLDGVHGTDFLTEAEHTALGSGSPHHAEVTLGAGNNPALALSGQELTLTLPAAALDGSGTATRLAQWQDTDTLEASTLIKDGAGVLTLSAAGAYTLTVPATGTAVLINYANAGYIETTSTLRIPTTTSTVGQILQNGVRLVHSFGTSSLFLGSGAGNFTHTGSGIYRNLGVGEAALASLTTGYDNIALGAFALDENTTGLNNVAIGSNALTKNVDGIGNFGLGSSSLTSNVSGYYNVAIGNESMLLYAGAAPGGYNVAIGSSALRSNVSGYENTVIGGTAGYLGTGIHNVFIGYAAGYSNVGNASIAIGRAAGYNETASNTLYIHNAYNSSIALERIYSLLYGTFSNGTPASQQLTINGVQHVNPQFTAAGIGTVLSLDAQGSGANGDGGSISLLGKTSTTAAQSMCLIQWLWNDATHAKADLVLSAYDTAVREGLRIRGGGSAPYISFYGGTPIARGAALTTQLTTLTHTAPGTPDYALQDLIDSSAGAAFGFATKDEGNTVLSCIANLQTRVAELEARLNAGTGVNLIA